MVVLFDREEVTGDATPPWPGEPRISAVMDLEGSEWIKVFSALTFAHVRRAIREGIIGNAQMGQAMDDYNRIYGVNPWE
jgi:hypothetical protein